ncbi:MAG TPA: hypothetical protein DIT04_07685 [Dysgonomonas sp.]|nr:hypothetical protein [Dysgonomonas sp.]
MNNHKITFPLGYLDTNIFNDNVDVNIVFETGEVYFGTLITMKNIESFINRGDIYFWCTNMFIVKDLKKETIRAAILKSLFDKNFKDIFTKIGDIAHIFEGLSYNDLIDMNDLATENCAS